MVFKIRKKIRLKNYDYSDSGWYFVTICTQNRKCMLGDVVENKIRLNNLGKIIYENWCQIPNYYKNVDLDEFQIMPNHIHGIIIIGRENRAPTLKRTPTLGQIIAYFKYESTKCINNVVGVGSSDPNDKFKKLFQRNYYEHIIRNEKELNKIRQYIKDNPINWDEDEDNLKSKGSES